MGKRMKRWNVYAVTYADADTSHLHDPEGPFLCFVIQFVNFILIKSNKLRLFAFRGLGDVSWWDRCQRR